MGLVDITMNTYREASIGIGVLYILVFVAGFLSIAYAVDGSDYLTKSAQNSTQIWTAGFFQFLMAIFYLAITIVLYPILKIYNEKLAVGYLSFRIIAVVFVLVGTVILLLILKLSQGYVKANSPGSEYYLMAGERLKTARDLVNHVGMVIALCIGGVLVNVIMIQSRLIPIWLSVWGLFGSVIAILASMLVWKQYIKIETPVYMILNMPIALQEIVFAVWLIVKGFKLF